MHDAGPMPSHLYPSSDVAHEVLRQVRAWGWDEGHARLQRLAEAESDAARRGRLRLMAGWLAGERGDGDQSVREFIAAGDSAGLITRSLSSNSSGRNSTWKRRKAWPRSTI